MYTYIYAYIRTCIHEIHEYFLKSIHTYIHTYIRYYLNAITKPVLTFWMDAGTQKLRILDMVPTPSTSSETGAGGDNIHINYFHPYIHTYINTYLHTNIYTCKYILYIHTYIHTYIQFLLN